MPGRVCSPAFLTVIWFVSLYLSQAQIQTDEVSELRFGRLDSNVTLLCGTSPTRTPVTWQLNNSSALPLHRVTSDGGLVLIKVELSAQGDYSCWDGQGLLLHAIRLRLGHPPGLLNISCRVPNHTHVRCSWVDTAKTFLPSKYSASFRGKGPSQPCIVDAVHKHCDIQHPAFWQTLHILSVTETNGLGSQTTTHRITLHKLLKPDPPEAVSVRQVEGFSTRLRVSWNFPSSWPLDHAFPLIFRIRYRPLGSMFWSESYSMKSSEEIYDALAGHLHQVQVQARDEVDNESQWSEWSPLLLVQPWEVHVTPESAEEASEGHIPTFQPEHETSTAKTHFVSVDGESQLGLVIVLVLFFVVVLATFLSLVSVVWFRQRRRDHVSTQEVASVVKMKSMPI